MDIQQLTDKAKSGETLTKAEQEFLMTYAVAELDELRNNEPEKFLKLVTELNKTLEDINNIIEEDLNKQEQE